MLLLAVNAIHLGVAVCVFSLVQTDPAKRYQFGFDIFVQCTYIM